MQKETTQQTIKQGQALDRELGIYIHVPFCIQKCNYCDFLSASAKPEEIHEYFHSLYAEIESYKNRTDDYKVSTIFIGGGTPSSVDPGYIIRVLELIRSVFSLKQQLEITIEINPGTINKEKLALYHRAGINRLSFGLQSADTMELKILGRIHNYEEFLTNYHLAREMSFSNINIDLMSAIPYQTLSSWENTLLHIIKLKPEHISAYSLIVEEGTQFFQTYGEDAPNHNALPDEETDRLMYQRTAQLLREHGYHQYEISNYALEGYECQHNTSYWVGKEYLGLGLGASSLIQNVRFKNSSNRSDYHKKCRFTEPITKVPITKDPLGIRTEITPLSLQDQMEEFMFLGLRMCQGISKTTFYQRFHQDINVLYKEALQKMLQNKLIIENKDRIYLTDRGIDLSNLVFSEFLFDA